MLVKKLLKLLITVSLVASACQPATQKNGLAPTQIAPEQAQSQIVKVEHSIAHRLPTHSPHLQGQITTVNHKDRINFKVNIVSNSTQGFSIQALDKTQIRYVRMYVTGADIGDKVWNNNGFIDVKDLNATVQISGIPKGSNRILTAIAYDENKVEIPGAKVKGYYSSTTSGLIEVEVTWKFIPVANAIEELIKAKDNNALNSFDVVAFQEAVETLIYGDNDRNGNTFLVHPTLLDVDALTKLIKQYPKLEAEQLVEQLKNSNNFLIKPQTLKGIVTGLVKGESLEITSNDPATTSVIKLVATGDEDVFAFSDATPGDWIFTVHNLTRDEVLSTKTAPGGSTIRFMTYDEVIEALLDSRDPLKVEAAKALILEKQEAVNSAQENLSTAKQEVQSLAKKLARKASALQLAQSKLDKAQQDYEEALNIKNTAAQTLKQLKKDADPARIKQAEKDLDKAKVDVKKAQVVLTDMLKEMRDLFWKYHKLYTRRQPQNQNGGGFQITTLNDGRDICFPDPQGGEEEICIPPFPFPSGSPPPFPGPFPTPGPVPTPEPIPTPEPSAIPTPEPTPDYSGWPGLPPKPEKPEQDASLIKKAKVWQGNLTALYDYAVERVDFIESRMDKLTASYKQAQQAVNSAQQQLNQAKNNVTNAENNVAQMEKRHARAQVDFTKAQQAYRQNPTRPNLAKLEKAKAYLGQMEVEKGKAIVTLNKSKTALRNAHNLLKIKVDYQHKLKSIWEEGKDFLEKEEKIFNTFKKEYQSLMKAVDKAIDTLKNSNKKVKEAKANISRVKASVEKAKKALPHAQAALKKAKAALEEAQENRDRSMRQRDRAQAEYDRTNDAHKKAKATRKAAKKQLVNAEAELAKAQNALEAIKYRNAHLEKVKVALDELLNQNDRPTQPVPQPDEQEDL